MNDIVRQSPLPYYEQIKDLLREKIARGEYKPERPIPDERALARELGLSRMTVRRAFVELSREGLLQRVRGKGTFVRGSFAPQRRRRRLDAIGIVAQFDWTEVGNSLFYHRLLAGIQQASEEAGLLLAIRRITEPYEAFAAALRQDAALKGLLIVGQYNPALLRQLAQIPLPSVLVDSCQPDPLEPSFNEVNHTADRAAYLAVESLIRLGHRDIGLIRSESDTSFNLERQGAWERALRDHGLPVRADRVYPIMCCGQAAFATVRRLLHENDLPTAIFCVGGDEQALGAMAAAADRGLRVPRDLSVIGFGDTAGFSGPPLSTVRIPIEQLGATSVRVLLERFTEPTAPLKRVMLPCAWISRSTCDCPRREAAIVERT